jgi:hypothetical protein
MAYELYIGEGVSSSYGTYYWGKHTFNPTPNPYDASHTWDYAIYNTQPAYIINSSNLFNLSSYKYGQEVNLSLFTFEVDSPIDITVSMSIYNPLSQIIKSNYSFNFTG